jgi:UDP-3-O-[3-hydroxymyristoyl] glucosamine N-acyltransferase
MERTLADICAYLDGELIGDGATLIRGVNSADAAQAGEVTFSETPQRLAQALSSHAAAIIVSPDVRDLQGRSGVRVRHPKLAFALLLELFHPQTSALPGVHPSAVLGARVQILEGVSIGPHAVIGDDVSIGRGTTVAAGVVVGDGVTIGQGCLLDPNVVIYRRTQIGDRVQIHGGSVIGGDGFGYAFHQGAYVKVPQVGNVVIEDDVEIGCNVCVDRATVGSTLIRQGTKLDNLVQVAHNDRIGKHVIMTGQVGLSGSVTVGDYAVMGGKAGVVDHVTIGERAQIGAASVVTKDVKAGETVWGFPARPLQDTKRSMGVVARLPLVWRTLTRLMERVHRLETRLGASPSAGVARADAGSGFGQSQ